MILTGPILGAVGVAALGMLAVIGVQSWRLDNCHDALKLAKETIAVRDGQIEVQNAAVDSWKSSADKAAQASAQALAAARAASATRKPQIEALAVASQASGPLTCGDAVVQVRDALGR